MRYIHIAPCFGTSKGHRRIHNCITAAVGEVSPSSNVELALDPSDDILEDDSPAIIVVDFPDVSWWRWLTPLIRSRKYWRSVYLAMATNLKVMRTLDEERETQKRLGASFGPIYSPPPYDRIVSCEPGAVGLVRHDNALDVRQPTDYISPLIAPIPSIQSIESSGILPLPCGIVITSGFQSEQSHYITYRKECEDRTGMPFYLLKTLEYWHGLPVEIARRSIALLQHHNVMQIHSAAGYSAFWEIFMLQKELITTWITTPRPIEDIDGRRRLLAQDKLSVLATSKAWKARVNRMYVNGAPISPGVLELAQCFRELERDLLRTGEIVYNRSFSNRRCNHDSTITSDVT